MAEADDFVAVQPDGSGKQIDAEKRNTAAGNVYAQRVVMSGALAVELLATLKQLVRQQKITNMILVDEFEPFNVGIDDIGDLES